MSEQRGKLTPEAERLLQQADRYHDLGRGGEAKKHLERLLAANPEDPEILCRLSMVYQNQGEHDEAIVYARRASLADPESEHAHRLLSISYRNRGRHQEALAAAERAAECAPDEPYALCVLADAQREAGLHAEAHETAKRLVELDPSSMSHDTLGLCYFDRELWTLAERHFRKAVELNPESYPAMNNLGSALMQRGELAESIDCFVRAARLKPTDPVARDNILLATRYFIDNTRRQNPGLSAFLVGVMGMIVSYAGGGPIVLVIGLACFVLSFALYNRLRGAIRESLPPEALEYVTYASPWNRLKRWIPWPRRP